MIGVSASAVSGSNGGIPMAPSFGMGMSGTRQLAHLGPIHHIDSPGYHVAYPRLVGRDCMPEEVFALSDQRWRQGWFPQAPVRFYRLHNVIVAAEGLVFDEMGNLYAETRKAHGDDEIRQAREAIAAAGVTAPGLPRFSHAVLCKQSGSENYGHWLTEMLPKAYFARSELGLRNYLHVVPKIDGQLAEVVRESLEMIGIEVEEHLPLDGSPHFFHELIVIEGLTNHSVYMSPLVSKCLQHLSDSVEGKGVKRVYLRRWPAKARDFEDEERITEHLTSKGFVPMATSSLSFRDQIAMIKDAGIVLGTMGAAMSNVVFCGPGTETCVFGPASAREFFYWFLSNLKHQVYYEIRCPESGPALGPLPWDRRFTFATQEMERFLGRLWG